MTKFTIGCDPEIFLKKKGKPLSAHGMIEGTKKEPFKVKDGAYQVDGMAVEFNTDPVPLSSSANAFDAKITSVLATLKEAVLFKDRDAKFNLAPVQDFGKEIMDETPDEAKELGCDPDFCAYTLQPNPRPEGEAVTFRTASGHIHVGWGADIPVDHPEHLEICAGFIKMMDLTVGMYMTVIDDNQLRRSLYGKAGAFRPKPYGVEYRTPSNMWLTKKSRRSTIYHLTRVATDLMSRGLSADKMYQYFNIANEEEAQRIINEGDYKKAITVLTWFKNRGYFDYVGRLRNDINTEINERTKKEEAAEELTDSGIPTTDVALTATSGIANFI